MAAAPGARGTGARVVLACPVGVAPLLVRLLILLGLIALRPALTGRSQAWWDVALAIQIWHHFEHALLLGQVLAAHNLFGAAVPASVLQLFFPRVELHLAYNAAVSFPFGC